MIGTVLYSTIVSLGFTYAGFRSFQALKSENEEKLMQDSSVFHASDFLDGGGSIPPPPDEEEEDSSGKGKGSDAFTTKTWIRFWVVCGVLRMLATVFSSRFEDLQILLILCLLLENKSQDLIIWFYTTFAEPGLKRFDVLILPYCMKFYIKFMSSCIEFTRRAHSFIVRESLSDISNKDIDQLEISLKKLGKIVMDEKRKRRIADFKLSQQRLSSVASKYSNKNGSSSGSGGGSSGDNGEKPPLAPQAKPYTNFQPMMEINLDEDIDNNDSNDLNSLRRRHRGSVTDKKKKRRERATMGVSPYMRDSSNSGPLYKDS